PNEFANEIIKDKPDLIIHGMTDSLSKIIPIRVKEKLPNTIQVMSMWDFRPRSLNYDGLWDTWTKSGPYLDLITLSNKSQVEWWEKDFGVETMYWPHGCVVKDVEYSDEYASDTVFTGDRHASGPYNARVEFIEKISKYVPIVWINKGGGDSDPERGKVWQDLGKIYHSAKTVLDISHFWNDPGYASGRYFYTSGLGGCAISKRFPDCEELFPEGTKIYFDTPEEAADKIKFYITNEKERNEVKRRGKEWCNKYHSYEIRFKELFNKLDIK
ncbi:MAG: glycosyltransferase, partial [Candidatus Paceibacterota bacterium]